MYGVLVSLILLTYNLCLFFLNSNLKKDRMAKTDDCVSIISLKRKPNNVLQKKKNELGKVFVERYT